MSLAETLLAKLAEVRTSETEPRTIRHVDSQTGWSVALTVEKADALSCRLTAVVCERSPNSVALRDWCESLAKKVTGLMEPLRVVEVDETRNEAILRSDAPTVRNQTSAHFEMRLTDGRKATLARFVMPSETGAKRQQTSFVLTHESLTKLIDDLTNS